MYEKERIHISIYTSVYTSRKGLHLVEIRKRNFRQLLSDFFEHVLTNTRNGIRQMYLNIKIKLINAKENVPTI